MKEVIDKPLKEVKIKIKNLKDIQSAFLHCYYKHKNINFFFEKLALNQEIDFSRYNYFYATYLSNIGKIDQAKKIVNSSLKLYPRNLILNQYKLDLDNGKYENNFLKCVFLLICDCFHCFSLLKIIFS